MISINKRATMGGVMRKIALTLPATAGAVILVTTATKTVVLGQICLGCCNDGCQNAGYVTVPGECPSRFIPCGLNVAVDCDGTQGKSYCSAFDRGSTCDIECWEGKSCTGCGVGCFLPNTKIATPGGEMNIQDLKVGDKVIGVDVDTGEKKETTVEDIYKTRREGYYQVTIEKPDGTRQVLRVTGEHPLWVKRKVTVKLLWETVKERIKRALGR